MRNLAQEITVLKDDLKTLLEILDYAEHKLEKNSEHWSQSIEDDVELVYFRLFVMGERSQKLRNLIAEGERKAHTQTTQEILASLAQQGGENV